MFCPGHLNNWTLRCSVVNASAVFPRKLVWHNSRCSCNLKVLDKHLQPSFYEVSCTLLLEYTKFYMHNSADKTLFCEFCINTVIFLLFWWLICRIVELILLRNELVTIDFSFSFLLACFQSHLDGCTPKGKLQKLKMWCNILPLVMEKKD